MRPGTALQRLYRSGKSRIGEARAGPRQPQLEGLLESVNEACHRRESTVLRSVNSHNLSPKKTGVALTLRKVLGRLAKFGRGERI